MEKLTTLNCIQEASPGIADKSASKSMTQTQIGTIGEVTVAAQLMLASEGRFSPFLPFADDDGIDLIVYDKVTGISLPVQVKARTSAKLGKSDKGTTRDQLMILKEFNAYAPELSDDPEGTKRIEVVFVKAKDGKPAPDDDDEDPDDMSFLD